MNSSQKTGKIVRLGLLVAILIVMEVTNIGYIKTPTGLELTLMQIPVLIGAIIMGPAEGAILGGVFGLTSFFQCFGKSQFRRDAYGNKPGAHFYCLLFPQASYGPLLRPYF